MRARIFAGMMLLLAVFSTLAQAQVVVTDDANTSSLSPKSNYGSSIALIVCSGSNTYVKFSFANLGSGITSSNVSKATLVLYTDFVLTSGTMDVYQVNGSWSEGSVTYNRAPALGTKLFSAVSVTKTGFLSLDLTSSVQAWLNGTLANNGIALVPSSGSAISVSFDSKENIFTSHSADLDLVLVSAGAQGPQGPQGPTGATGSTGPAGPTGATGAQGAVGPQGQAGATGPQGATGLTGPPGSQGPQGVMGLTGATGPQGSTGQQGMQGLMGLTGLTGATGPAGPQGPNGANGTGFNFRTAFDNSASYVVNDVVTYNGSSYVATVANQGAGTPDTNPTDWTLMAQQGATGPAGTAGAQGPQGPAGPTGRVGPAGPVGPMPTGAALTTTPNTFSGTQTVNGSLILAGTGSGVQFPDGTSQTTAATGSSSGVPSGFMILGSSPTAPAGYTLSGGTTSGNVWSLVASMPIFAYQLAACTVNGKIYAIGGYGNTSGGFGTSSLGTLEVYDPSANSWSTAAPMPTATWDLAAAAVNGKIYAIGGLFSYNLVANDVNIVEVYDPSTNTWTTAAPMPTARHFLTAAAVNGKIYAIGGTVNQTGNILSTVEVYDPSANSWSTAASMPTARFGLAAAVVNGKIYAIGGQGLYSGSPVNLSTVEAYDPSTNTWTTAPSMPTARYGLAAAAVNGNIYAIGGISNNGYSNVVEVDDLFTNTWTTAASIPTSAEAYLAATDANGLIYAMGGAFLNGFLVPTNSVEQYSPPVTLYTFIKN